jgi:lactam utilization protein B
VSVAPKAPPKKWEHMTPRERAEVHEAAARARQAAHSDWRDELDAKYRARQALKQDAAARAPAFLAALEALCREHNISIEHEDQHGGFELVPFNDRAMEWMRASIKYVTPAGDGEVSP